MPTAAVNPRKIRCVPEHNGGIPPAHKLLVERGSDMVLSTLWNMRAGIAPDFAGGVVLLRDLLRSAGQRLADGPDLAECVAGITGPSGQAAGHVLRAGDGRDGVARRRGSRGGGAVPGPARHPRAVGRAEAAIVGEDGVWLASLRADWQHHFTSIRSEALHFPVPDEREEQQGTRLYGSIAPASQPPLSRCRAALR
ncbi:hypothetical protein ACGF8B_31050 [Streptomyces sp. NPDC047917]|uniref:DUF7822 domain-containing protein n=1 Tax=Streptomyces sp. NPDC047917 TaxID=3365491 RepID=UPI003722CD95